MDEALSDQEVHLRRRGTVESWDGLGSNNGFFCGKQLNVFSRACSSTNNYSEQLAEKLDKENMKHIIIG